MYGWKTPGKLPTVPYLPTLVVSFHPPCFPPLHMSDGNKEMTVSSEAYDTFLGLDPSVFKQAVCGVERCSSWAMPAPCTRDEIRMADHDSGPANPEMAPHLSSKFEGFLVSQGLLGSGYSCCLLPTTSYCSRELSGCPGCRCWCVSTWTSTASNRVW